MPTDLNSSASPRSSTAASSAPTMMGGIDEPLARIIGIGAACLSIVVSGVLLLLYRELGGPGDQLWYYERAADLLPFTDNWYGPGYFAVLRVVHELGLDWFTASKIISWLSACAMLVLTARLLLALLPRSIAWLSLALVALNPTFIGESYSALTIMLGAAVITLAVLLTVSSDHPRQWFVAGLVFGVGVLTRFQTTAFLLGAIVGAVFLVDVPIRRRIAAAAALAVGGMLPSMLWSGFLMATQGSVPANHNFVHLTLALGQFNSFSDVPHLIDTYHSMRGVLTSEPLAIVKILKFALKEAAVFPFFVGLPLLFLAAGFLVPGAVRTLVDRRAWTPWLGAYVAGFLLTGIGSQRWLHYYTALLPFLVLLAAYGLATLDFAPPKSAARVAWLGVLVSSFAFSLYRCRVDFNNRYWPEFTVARAWLNRSAADGVIAGTAWSISYESRFRFVNLNSLINPNDWSQLVPRLRAAGVTQLVLTARHGPDVFPQMTDLLQRAPIAVPAGLRLDTLIVDPQPLAIFRVLPAPVER